MSHEPQPRDPSGTESQGARSRSRPRLPWAGLGALGLVVLFEVNVLGEGGPWQAIQDRLALRPVQDTRLEMGIARDHLELARLAAAEPGMQRVIVTGNSRAKVGLVFEELDARTLGPHVVAKCTHAPIAPWIMHSAVGRFLAHDPDLVLLVLSEMDTHRGPNTVPAATFGDLETLGTLARGLGLADSWERRSELMQLGLASVLRSYRYRPVLGHVGLDGLRHFPVDEALGTDGPRYPSARPRYDAPSDELPDVPGIEAIQRDIARTSKNVRPHTLRLVNRIRVGEHVALQERFVEQAVVRWRAAGVQVLVVEGPLNPACYPLYERERTNGEFVAFAERLVREHGAHFMPLSESGPFPPEAFADLLHLRPEAARRWTRDTLRRIDAILGEAGE